MTEKGEGTLYINEKKVCVVGFGSSHMSKAIASASRNLGAIFIDQGVYTRNSVQSGGGTMTIGYDGLVKIIRRREKLSEDSKRCARVRKRMKGRW